MWDRFDPKSTYRLGHDVEVVPLDQPGRAARLSGQKGLRVLLVTVILRRKPRPKRECRIASSPPCFQFELATGQTGGKLPGQVANRSCIMPKTE